MIPQALACINKPALRHNLEQVKQRAPHAKILAVIKANAYGHDAAIVAETLTAADACAVGTIDEAEALRAQIELQKPVVILQGVTDRESLLLCFEYNYEVVVHSRYQIELLEKLQAEEKVPPDKKINVWLKMDTGMHRLGFSPAEFAEVSRRLSNISCVNTVTLMSHLACADEPQRQENQWQLDNFQALAAAHAGGKSLCNSAGMIEFGAAHYDWVRPGIMLYGISPVQDKSAEELDLKPVMTLKSRLIAVNQCKQGDQIGYGASWECPEDMPVGVIGFGYGDGYPRHVPSGTPVLVNGKRLPIIGRVSMDLITVDLRPLNDSQGVTAKAGDQVILWGEGLPIESIAAAAGTIAYELVCRLTSRVSYMAVD